MRSHRVSAGSWGSRGANCAQITWGGGGVGDKETQQIILRLFGRVKGSSCVKILNHARNTGSVLTGRLELSSHGTVYVLYYNNQGILSFLILRSTVSETVLRIRRMDPH